MEEGKRGGDKGESFCVRSSYKVGSRDVLCIIYGPRNSVLTNFVVTVDVLRGETMVIKLYTEKDLGRWGMM